MMKSDLSDFYYNLRIPAWMSRWFALPAVPGWLVGKPERALVDVGFGVLSMGSSHAVVLAQEAHLEILRRAGLPFERRLVDGEPLVEPGPFFVVQIDDFVIGASEAEDRETAAEWLDVALASYAAAGLPVAEHKVERDAHKALWYGARAEPDDRGCAGGKARARHWRIARGRAVVSSAQQAAGEYPGALHVRVPVPSGRFSGVRRRVRPRSRRRGRGLASAAAGPLRAVSMGIDHRRSFARVRVRRPRCAGFDNGVGVGCFAVGLRHLPRGRAGRVGLGRAALRRIARRTRGVGWIPRAPPGAG